MSEPAYNVNSKATVGQLKALALRAKSAVSAAIQALPIEMFLDTANTQFVGSFAWSSTTYPSSTNPNMEGKPVLVLAMKSKNNETGVETTTYSFLNMATLVDTYTTKSGSSSNVLNISGYEIEFKLDSSTYNKASITSNGLLVDVRVANATNGHFAGLDGSGNLTDSGVASSDVLTKISGTITAGAVPTITSTGGIANSSVLLNDVVTKVSSATAGHLAGLDSNGKLTDSGIVAANVLTTADVATDTEVTAMLNEVFGEPGD